MKYLFFAAAMIFSTSTFVLSQKAAGPQTVNPAGPERVFSRERFDPTRDPAADLAAAVEIAAKSRKRIILDVGGEWCGWCVYMDKFFYLNPEITKLRDDNFVWVKVNFSEENENKAFLSQFPTPTGYPYFYVLDETGKLLQAQRTAQLEAGNDYDRRKFTAFLKDWAPKKALTEKPAEPAVSNTLQKDAAID